MRVFPAGQAVTEERFQRLYATAYKAFNVRGDDLARRSAARREYRQALDLLELESDPEQWARVESAIAVNWK